MDGSDFYYEARTKVNAKGVHFHFTETNYAFFFQVGFLSNAH